MTLHSCIPILPSSDLEASLRLWVDALGCALESEMKEDGKLVFCMLRKGNLRFMLNRRAGTRVKPDDYEGIRLYWAPDDLRATRQRLQQRGYAVSDIVAREYGQTEFFLTDDDGYSHCFGVATVGSPITTVSTLVAENGVRIVEFAIAAGASGPWHHHSHVVEQCCALAGAIVVEREDQSPVRLAPGQRCEIPARVRHRVRNEATEPGGYLVIQGVGEYDFVTAPGA